MKPSEKQKDLIAKISSEIAGWANINDIDNKFHWNLIENFCQSLELQNLQQNRLNNALDQIMEVVKRSK
jgi:hypothetical protein